MVNYRDYFVATGYGQTAPWTEIPLYVDNKQSGFSFHCYSLLILRDLPVTPDRVF
jgi:hypothetical protein